MGYYYGAPSNTNLTGIKHFEPDNDANTLYIRGEENRDLDYVMDLAKNHFGDNIEVADLEICAEYVHTRCIGYDRYDAGDYENFIVLRRKVKVKIGETEEQRLDREAKELKAKEEHELKLRADEFGVDAENMRHFELLKTHVNNKIPGLSHQQIYCGAAKVMDLRWGWEGKQKSLILTMHIPHHTQQEKVKFSVSILKNDQFIPDFLIKEVAIQVVNAVLNSAIEQFLENNEIFTSEQA